MNLLIRISLIFIMFPSIAFSAWTAPKEILSLNFGNGETEIAIISGDIEDQFTTLFAVDTAGNVLVADQYNRKTLVFNNTGQYVATIRPKITLAPERVWPNKIYSIPNNRSVIASGYDYQIYDYQGNLLKKINAGDNTALIGVLSDGSLIIKGSVFYKYSTAGQLVQSNQAKPLELGNLHQSVPANGNYKFILEYPDITYSFTIPNRIINLYYRDAGNKLGISYTEMRDFVYKINSCGKILGIVQLPNDEISGYTNAGGEKYANYIAQYGNATFGADGNVYTWKKTDSKFSILKWTWVDDPNVPTGPDAPSGLTVTPSINGLYLTWKASPNDLSAVTSAQAGPGCVTKYEIARSTTSGGVFSTIDSVEKGVLKYNDTTAETGTTYYYKVRAMAGSDPSAYTAEVSGKR